MLMNKNNNKNNNKNTTEQVYPPMFSQYNERTKALKPLLFIDIDEVILDSHKTLISILNSNFHLHNTPYELSTLDIKEWNFETVLNKLNNYLKENNITHIEEGTFPLTKEYILHIFETEEYWDKVWYKKGAYCLLRNLSNKYHIYFLTKGTDANIAKKAEWFYTQMGVWIDYTLILIPLNKSKEDAIYSEIASFLTKAISQGVKSSIVFDTLQVIQVDDNYSNLAKCCNLNILLKEQEKDYNQVEDTRENLYIINNLNELWQILAFYSSYCFDSLEEINYKRKTFKEYIKAKKEKSK